MNLKYHSDLKYLSDFVYVYYKPVIVRFYVKFGQTALWNRHLVHQIVLAIAGTVFEPNIYFIVLFYLNSTYNLTITYTDSEVVRLLSKERQYS